MPTLAQFLNDMAAIGAIGPGLNLNAITVGGRVTAIVDATNPPPGINGGFANVFLRASPSGVYVRPGTLQARLLNIPPAPPGQPPSGGAIVLPGIAANLVVQDVGIIVHELGHAYGYNTQQCTAAPGSPADETYACKKELEWLAMLNFSNTLTGGVILVGLGAYATARINAWRNYNNVQGDFYNVMNACGVPNAGPGIGTLWP